MNLRNLSKTDTDYIIGLDMGTTSVGWAVIDENGELLHFKGKPTWGSRLFAEASFAQEARAHRGQRRRYERRRWRIGFLQGFFVEEMAKTDPNFFIRLSQSSLLLGDKTGAAAGFRQPLFCEGFAEADYYKRFPTIFHLRQWLMETDEKADIRLIYLALHNIVKHRGNFLHEDEPDLSASNADMNESVGAFCRALAEYCDIRGIACASPDDMVSLASLLGDKTVRGKDKESAIPDILSLAPGENCEVDTKAMAKQIAKALLGYKADFSKVFECQAENSAFRFSDEGTPDVYEAACSDDELPLYVAMRAVYSSYVLMGMLTKKGLSLSKIDAYDQYGADLATLKSLVREYAPEEYSEFFRGPLYGDGSGYDAAKAKGYTRYDLGLSKKGSGGKGCTYDDFKKDVEKLFKGTEAIGDERYQDMMARFAEEKFLCRLRTSDNGPIPYQLNLEEMTAIIQNQGRFYPFLLEHQREIESLVKFRIPYYVGPLTQKNARLDKDGNARFAWSKRLPGKEDAVITPWNWDEVIDKHASAESFIKRMTGTCTYIEGEPVLPRCSLLYEEFCVLNELNGARWTQDGDKFVRFSYDLRRDMVDELFKNRKVTYKVAENWLRQRGFFNAHVEGAQGEAGFESKMSSYIFFCKDVFKVDELPEEWLPKIEKIILWSTLFEDRSILKEKIELEFGDWLTPEQIKTICKKRFTGWGRLSEKLLCGLKREIDGTPLSIMDIMREGDPVGRHLGHALVFQEILHDDRLGFEEAIEQENKARREAAGTFDINDLQGSPALRRSVNQARRIVAEIAGIAGKAPKSIFVEVTREDEASKRGKRTTRRYDVIKEALQKLGPEGKDALHELKGIDPAALDEKLTLYFMQNGKSLYSGKPLDIRSLTKLQVDHIIPQSYIKDDSYDNKALVFPWENQRKSDSLLLDDGIRRNMKREWDALHEAGLMSDKKHSNLLRTQVPDARMKGFIARQLVETGQMVKLAQQVLRSDYPDTQVLPVKASLSSELRDECELAKCRDANDYHHAHDAYLAAQIGRFVQKRHPQMYDDPIGMTRVMRAFVRKQGEEFNRTRKLPGSASRCGFVIQSFLRSGFDQETGEVFQDDWNSNFEIARIKKCFNYRDCYITRKTEVNSGAFWDATIYSPRASKNLSLPIKIGLSIESYGGYSREQFAYFFVFKTFDPKKKRYAFAFEPVPIRLAAKIESDPGALSDYARRLCSGKNLELVEIVRNKICKNQLIEVDGDRLFVRGSEEERNAVQIAFSSKDMLVLKSIFDGVVVEIEDYLRLYDGIASALERRSKALSASLRLGEFRNEFMSLSSMDMSEILKSVLSVVSASNNTADMSLVGGSKNAGRIRLSYAKLMNSKTSSFAFIDQSVTGMFENRQVIEL
ncbi:MAG: type II CRISPR RNA-guided endonuclease Cas9 [Eggerthellaceae bacterium]